MKQEFLQEFLLLEFQLQFVLYLFLFQIKHLLLELYLLKNIVDFEL